MASKDVLSSSADESEQELAGRRRLETRLIAQGTLPFPTGLDPATERRLVLEVRRLRRQRLVDMIALLVARHLATQRTD